VARVASRTGHGFTSEDAARGMYRDFAGTTLDARHLCTSGQEDPGRVARQVLDGIGTGRLLWTAPG
jgi:hypothetical protein